MQMWRNQYILKDKNLHKYIMFPIEQFYQYKFEKCIPYVICLPQTNQSIWVPDSPVLCCSKIYSSRQLCKLWFGLFLTI